LAILGGGTTGLTGSEAELPFSMIDLVTGATLDSGTLTMPPPEHGRSRGRRWTEIALVPSPGEWLTYVESSREGRLLDLVGTDVDHVADLPPTTSRSWPG
jgi:hypothetical protein